MTRLRSLRWGGYPDYPGEPCIITKVLNKGKVGRPALGKERLEKEGLENAPLLALEYRKPDKEGR